MKRIFILEDDPLRIVQFRKACIGHDLTLAVDCDEAKRLWQPPYDLVCLDHDLGGETFVDSRYENTGFQFCRFLTEPQPFKDLRQTPFIVHSYNPEGAYQMYRNLKDAGYIVYRIPFGLAVLHAVEHGLD